MSTRPVSRRTSPLPLTAVVTGITRSTLEAPSSPAASAELPSADSVSVAAPASQSPSAQRPADAADTKAQRPADAADTKAPSAPSAARLNWLRAGVLGANDGAVSVAAVVVGVAGAAQAGAGGPHAIIMAGLAALVGGAVSMALGEYVSVASARDSQHASEVPVAQEEIANPFHAALASALAFVAGALLPFLAVILIPAPWTIPGTIAATLIGLALAGAAGARLGRAPMLRPVLRVLIGGGAALGLTFAVGALFGVAVA